MVHLVPSVRPSALARCFANLLTKHLQDLPLTHMDCDEFFTSMRDLVFENLYPLSRDAGSAGSKAVTDPSQDAGATGAQILLGEVGGGGALLYEACFCQPYSCVFTVYT